MASRTDYTRTAAKKNGVFAKWLCAKQVTSGFSNRLRAQHLEKSHFSQKVVPKKMLFGTIFPARSIKDTPYASTGPISHTIWVTSCPESKLNQKLTYIANETKASQPACPEKPRKQNRARSKGATRTNVTVQARNEEVGQSGEWAQ